MKKQESEHSAPTSNLNNRRIALITAIFLFFCFPSSFSQTLDFSFSKDTIVVGDSVRVLNTSTGWPSGTYFVWEVTNYYQRGHLEDVASYFDTTYSSAETLYLTFINDALAKTTLSAYDSTGLLLTDITRYLVVLKSYCQEPLTLCNYIYNPSFETESNYAFPWDHGQLHLRACNWERPLDNPNGAPVHADYFSSSCNAPLYQTPSNWTGYQDVMNTTETHYGGLFTYIKGNSPLERREYISQEIGNLDIGRNYVVGMYVSLSENSKYASNIGIFLHDNSSQHIYQCQSPHPYESYFYLGNDYNNYFQCTPQISTQDPIQDKDNWVLVVDTIAGNNQNYLIIGNFNDNANSNITLVSPLATFQDPSTQEEFTGSYYYIDNIFINPVHYKRFDTICIGSCLTLQSSSTEPLFIAACGWMWNTVPQPPQYTSPNITVCPQNDTLITCTVIDYTGCVIIDSFYIKVNYPPQAPIILGNRNNCDLSTTYQISNPAPNAEYYWGISNSSYSNDFPTQGQQITINWTQLWDLMDPAGFVWMYILSIDTTTQCYRLDSVKIWNCCVYENNAHINDVVITDNSIFTGSQLVLNGTITVNYSITVPSGNDIIMGPEAKIVVNPPYTFTINSRTVRAGCRFMWDGIYVSDSNAKVVIANETTMQDAYNAINSANGGKFELYSSNFVNNRIGLFVHDYFMPPAIPPLSRHKGIIKGCSFTIEGTGMIAPFLDQKPTYGVFADNVNLLTIGDSTSVNYTNNFSGLFCGIASFNSKLGVYNNTFIDIKPASPAVTDPADFISVQTETAIHSVCITDNLLQTNPSWLYCGGSATNHYSGNIFTNDQFGIYTYKTLSKLNNNLFSQATSWAIFLRDFKHQSYVNSNSIQNGSGWGIRVLNTVPNSSTGINMTISNNSITDPNSGIFVSNVTSSSSNSNYQTQLINNTIYLNGSTTLNRYGIRLQNSDNIVAYCNKVKRSTLVPVADSLRLKGIQLENCAGAYLHDNSFSKLSMGIKTSGIIGSTPFANANFKTNKLDSCYHAFYFATDFDGNTTVLSQQGATLNPTDNKFTNYPSKPDAYRLGGLLPSMPSYDWYYKTGTLYNVSIPIGHPLIYKIFPLSTTGYALITRCGDVMSMSMSQQTLEFANLASDVSQGQVMLIDVNDEASFGEITSEMKYGMDDYVYKLLGGMEQTSNSTAASVLQLYNLQFSNLKQRNIARFYEIKLLIDSGKIEEAKTLNRSLSPENQIEINRRFAYDTYLEYVVSQSEIPAGVLDQLQQLADTHPVIGGEGVYIARAILGYEEPLQADVKSASISLPDDEVILVYPNPANDRVNILMEGFDKEIPVNFELYNLTGALILNKQFSIGSEELTVDIHELVSGFYLLKINSYGQTIYRDRLIIVK